MNAIVNRTLFESSLSELAQFGLEASEARPACNLRRNCLSDVLPISNSISVAPGGLP